MAARLLSLMLLAALALPAVAAAAPDTSKPGPVFLGRGYAGGTSADTWWNYLPCLPDGHVTFNYDESPAPQLLKPAYRVQLKGTIATVTGEITANYFYVPRDAPLETHVSGPQGIELSGSVDTAAPGFDGYIKIPNTVTLTPRDGAGDTYRLSWPVWIALTVTDRKVTGFVTAPEPTCI